MKKRVLSLLLACMIVCSAIPIVSAQYETVTADNATAIASYQQFLDFLENSQDSDIAECKLTADITVPEQSEAIGGYNANNLHIDGNGYAIKGLKINNSLFGLFSQSSIRNLTFDSAVVESTDNKEYSTLAVVAQNIADKNSNITNCIFKNCIINLPDADADAAFAAVDNYGVVTNCKVCSDSVIKSSLENDFEYYAGGITVNNFSGSRVINCESRARFELMSNNIYCKKAGITVSNKGKVDLCYVSSDSVGEKPVVADSSSVGNSVYLKADGSFAMGKKTYAKDDLGIITADMSQNVMNYIQGYNSSVPLNQPDYPTLWCIEGGEPTLSFDLKTAQVYLAVDDSMEGAVLEFSLGAQEVGVSSGKRYSTALGKFDNGNYVRNTLSITYVCAEDAYQMVNSFVYTPAFKFIEDLINPYDNTNYSKTFITAQHNGTENKASVELLPYCWELSLSNVAEKDEIVDFEFSGKGTEDNPYKINSLYELKVLAHYVRQGDTDKSGNKYSAARYLLTTDLTDVTINPIGEYGNGMAFTGVFDGGAHIIKNLRITDGGKNGNTNSNLGLFGCVRGGKTPAEIKNLNIVNANVETQGDLCGIIVGQADNAIINGCVTSGKVSGGTQVAGIAGYAHNTKIYNCGSTAEVSTASANASAGGVVGYAENSVVRNCYYSGSIKCNNIVKENFLKVGGVTGYIEHTSFDNCYCNVSGKANLFDININGVATASADTLSSDAFLKELKDYSAKASFGTLWSKDTQKINQGYPVIADASDIEHSIECIPTDAGTVSSDFSAAKKGTKVTLTVHSQYEIKEIQITNLNREIQKVTCSLTKDGTYVFTMPAYSIRVVPVFDADLLLIGKGTEDDPYIIRNYAELNQVSKNCYYNKTPRPGCQPFCTAYYEVANDIDCENQTILPMGNRYYPFNAHFDGNGYTISNLVPKASSQQVSHDYAYPAVFGYCGSAEIHDVTFKNIQLSGSRAAVVASTVWGNTDIYNVTIKDCVFDNARYAGGFVSQCTNLRIFNCFADNVTFTNCTDSGYVIWSIMDSIYINNILVSNSNGVKKMIVSSNAKLSADDFTNYYACNTDVSEEKYIKESDNRKLITEVEESSLKDKVFIAELSENAYNINVNHTFSNLNFWGLGDKVEIAHENGVVGILPIHYDSVFDDENAFEMFAERVKASEINTTVSIPCTGLVDSNNITVTTASGNMVGFAFEEASGSGAFLTFVMPDEPVYIGNSDVVPTITDIPGTGTIEDPYRVSVPQHIKLISDVTNGYKEQYKDTPEDVDYICAQFILMNDVDMSPYVWSEPIGSENNPFKGAFDGKNFTINNLNTTYTTHKYYGLFGAANGATFKNINLNVNFYVSGNEDLRMGGICGFVDIGNSGTSALFSNCTVTGKMQTDIVYSIGGICGQIREYNTGIERCINKASVSADECDMLGGISGFSRSAINNCANFGALSGNNGWIGGICGGDNSAYLQINNCYNAGAMSGKNATWGEVSYNIRQTSNSYYLRDVYEFTDSTRNYLKNAAMYLDEFKSGYVAYLLNQGVTDATQVWYQNLDNGLTPEDFPGFDNNGLNTVYKNTTCTGEVVEYSNTEDEVIHDYNNYYVCKKCISLYPGKIAGIYGFDIGLSGSIELNYYMVLDEEFAKDHTARMVFTVPNGSKDNPDDTYEVIVPISDAKFDGTFYYFSCGIPAKEMGSDIYCQFVTNTMSSDVFRYSVKEYAEYILANPQGNEKEIPLIKSILNYGAYAQIALDYKTDDLANDSQYIAEEDKVLPEVDFSGYARIEEGEQKGVSYYGASMSHRSTTAITLYYYFENPKDVETLDITVNGKKVIPQKNNSYYEIVIDGTPAQAYHLNHVVKIGGLTTYYNVFSYGASVQSSNNAPEKLDLSKSMYVYNRELLEYMNS